MYCHCARTRMGEHILYALVCVGLLSLLLSCDSSKAQQKPLSLEQFTEISGISISPDGNQILFSGCGQKDYPPCTLYRFDLHANRLFRYLPRNSYEMLVSGRYSPSSSRITMSIIPLDANGDRNYDDTQIALMQQDGSGLSVVTGGKGLKIMSVLSYDEQNLAFFNGTISNSGSPLRKLKTMATRFDLYNIDLNTKIETRLTDQEFYGAGNAHFTNDNKKILFVGDSPLNRLYAKKNDSDTELWKPENIIFTRAIDGSDAGKELIPYFTYSYGSKMPVLFKDGSLIFQGRDSFQLFIRYFKRSPDGSLQEISGKDLGNGVGEDGKSLIILYEMAGTPDGRLLAILNHNQGTSQRYIRLLHLGSMQLVDLVLPNVIEDIKIRH